MRRRRKRKKRRIAYRGKTENDKKRARKIRKSK